MPWPIEALSCWRSPFCESGIYPSLDGGWLGIVPTELKSEVIMLYATIRQIAVSALFAGLIAVAVPTAAFAQTMSTADKQAIESIVREYILKNPELVIEAIELFHEIQRVAEEKAKARALTVRSDQIYSDPATPTSGEANAGVTIVEFFDYQCGYCRSMSRILLDLVDAKEDIRIVWKEFPILGADSVFASRAALAAGMQGKYLDFHRTLMITRSRLSQDWVMTLAEGIGLDVETLKKDMGSTEVTQQIDANTDLARQLGIRGTPAFIIDGKLFPGALEPDRLKQLIEDARKS